MNKTKRVTAVVLVLMLLTAVLGGCSQGEKTLKSADSRYQMTVPGVWSDKVEGAGEGVLLSAGYVLGSQFIMVSEITAESIGELSLQEYSETFSSYFSTQMTNASLDDPVAVTVNGHSGYQTKVSGESQGVGLTYWITLLDYGEYVPCLIAWTSTEKEVSGKTELDKVINSFGPAV